MDALLEATLRLAAPLLIAALGELIVERSGVINIGIEGMMLTGAFAGYAVAVATGSAGAGVVGAGIAGCAVGGVFAFATLGWRIDQIVAGMAVNLLALGATGLGARALWAGNPPPSPVVSPVAIPGLSQLPLVGSLFTQSPYAYGGVLLGLLIGWGLARTRAGVRLRAVGESARAADAEGVPVVRTRLLAVLAGATLAGIAGSSLSLALSDTFSEGMTSGRGFIALAVVIFGRWSAWGGLGAALFFGAATALQFRLQARGFGVPYPVFLMLPYVVTLAVLAFATGRARAPGDLGRPYLREGGGRG
jgi:simple sugar transport system permease protein